MIYHRWSRLLLVGAVFLAATVIYFLVQSVGDPPGYGIFHLLRGEAPPKEKGPSGDGYTATTAPLLNESEVPLLTRLNEEYAALTEAVVPSVVSISTLKMVYRSVPSPSDVGVSPQNQRYRAPGLGSGVIMTREGHVVTNHHVIADVDEIQVTLHDGHRYVANLIGSDPQTDVAVLQIVPADGDGALPEGGFAALPFGESDKVRVGEIVFSIGNPFGLSETVTRGIISNRERRITEMAVPFLQTDTVINPGSSGGPLVNLRGELIGINTDLYLGQAGLRTWQGIALAIPSNEVLATFEAIVSRDELGRGYLGIVAEDLFPEIAVQMNQPSHRGALVLEVLPGSPAEKAGLRSGDIVRKFAGQELDRATEFRQAVRRQEPGTTVQIVVTRQGETLTLTAKMTEQSAEVALKPSPRNPKARISVVAGVRVEELTPERKLELHLIPDSPAVIVTEIDPRSDIGRSGSLLPGDVIHEINRHPINTPAEFYTALDNMPLNRRSTLFVTRRGAFGWVMLVPSTADETPGQAPAGQSKSKDTDRPAPTPAPAPSASSEPDKSPQTVNR